MSTLTTCGAVKPRSNAYAVTAPIADSPWTCFCARATGSLHAGPTDRVDDALIAAADVVSLSDATTREDQVDRSAVVFNVQPLSTILTLLVQGQWQVIESVCHKQRDYLLRVLPWPVVVSRVRDGCRQR